MVKPVLIFRADAGSSMGTGHLMRSTALARILSSAFDCRLLTRCTISLLLQSVKDAYSTIEIIPETIVEEASFFQQLAGIEKLAVLDGYHFDLSYQQELKNAGFYLACIDDLVVQPHAADLLINHCGGLLPTQFKAPEHTVFGIGPQYALLDPLFQIPQAERRKGANNRNCMICLGGADPENFTMKILADLCGEEKFDSIHVIAGAAYRCIEILKSYVCEHKHVHLHHAITSTALKEIMKQCAYAVCSPSTIAYEYLSVGGFMWLKQIASNQEHIMRFLTGEGLAFTYTPGAVNPDVSSTLIFQQEKYFKGDAAPALEKLFDRWYESAGLHIRRAEIGDAKLCFDWANDPQVREQSYSKAAIPWENHLAWFIRKIKDANTFYYILVHQNQPAAQIRFDIDEKRVATISYLSGENFRGKGMGLWILAAGIQQLLRETNPQQIIGHVKNNNIASQRSFEKLAFVKEDSTAYPDSVTYTMTIHGN